jgi:diguanylate cyclase (GGDEF)-like protein
VLTRSRRVAIVTALAGFAVFAAWLQLDWGGATPTMIVGHVGAVGSSAFAFTSALVAGLRGRGRQRASWLCLAPGLAGWLIGDLTWTYFDVTVGTRPPFPSLADGAYFLLPVFACVAAMFSPGGRAGVRLMLDGVIVATSLFAVAWSLGLHAVYDAADVTAAGFVVSFTYPFADFAMITMMAVVLARSPAGRRRAPSLLLAGLVVIGISDMVFAHLGDYPPENGKAITLGWALGMILVGTAALSSRPYPTSDVVPPRAPSRAAVWLPYLPVPFAVALGSVALWNVPSTRPILATGLILVIATLVRQFTLLDENRRLLATVAGIALRDPLTGLPNRALFNDRLAHAMQLRLRGATSVTVVLLDLDDFKLVNDSLGHAAGDILLHDVGDRIHGILRNGDTVARLGGDEFAILIEDEPDVARAIAGRVLESFDEPFVLDGREVVVRPSVGLAAASSSEGATAVRDDVYGITGDELFRRADLAMYSAKRARFSGVSVFTPEMRHDDTELRMAQSATPGPRDGIAQIQYLAELRRAIDDHELTLVYQPKFSLTTGAVIGVEALVRWPHPELGLLEPAAFLPLVRRNGLMDAITDVVILRAVRDSAAWHAAGVDIPVAINLSAPSLDDEKLPDRLLSVLAEHGMPADSLSVEITEDLLLASVRRTRNVLDRLRGNGIRVAIDDFGSGYATMSYLRDLPVDELKLDRQFIAPILHDPKAAAIVRSVIELADTFGLASVAEGVENKATAERLKEYGCRFAQGHYFSPPIPAKAIQLGMWGAGFADTGITPTATTPPSWA